MKTKIIIKEKLGQFKVWEHQANLPIQANQANNLGKLGQIGKFTKEILFQKTPNG